MHKNAILRFNTCKNFVAKALGQTNFYRHSSSHSPRLA
jgi:hypothetical protein